MSMTSPRLVEFVVNMHTRTVVGLIDAAMRADTPAERDNRLCLARDAVLEFKAESLPMLLEAIKEPS